jgi:WD40 repeat protein
MNIGIPLLATLEENPTDVNSVAFHPTANPPLLASGSNDNTVRLWLLSSDNSSATCVATLAGHSNWVNSVAFHSTAPLLATGSSDKTVRLWLLSSDNSSATCVATLAGHSGYVSSVAFHHTEPLLATCSWDNTVRLWLLSSDYSSATRVATLDKSNGGHSSWVYSVVFHPTANPPLLATSSHDKTVKIWDCTHLTNRWQLATASRGFAAMTRLLAQRLGHNPSLDHRRAFKNNRMKEILATTTRKSLARMFGSTVAARIMKQYFSHGARAPGMPGMMRMSSKLAVPQFPLQRKRVLTLKNDESSNGSKSPKDSKGGSRQRKIKAKNKSVKKKYYQ